MTTPHSLSAGECCGCNGSQTASCNALQGSSGHPSLPATCSLPHLCRNNQSTRVQTSGDYSVSTAGISSVRPCDQLISSALLNSIVPHQTYNSSEPVANASRQTSGQCQDPNKNQSSVEELVEGNKGRLANRNVEDSSERNDLCSSLGSKEKLNRSQSQPTIVDLPTELLFSILQCLPTISLIACGRTHKIFANLVNNTQFLNIHTRCVLGFPDNQKDITYDIVPAPVAPLQHMWFEEYLFRAAPHMVGLVQPGVIFYDLLCFKHLFDTWLLQGLGYKYRLFISDVLQCPNPPPLSFVKCKRFIMVPKHVIRVLVKVALCQPDILMLTVNDFEELSISCCGPPSDLDDVWDRVVPSEWRELEEPDPPHTCEVVSRQRGLALASFFITCNYHSVIGWSGVIDYSTFRWRDTWSLGRFSPDASLHDLREMCSDLFHKFRQYVGNEYISLHCPNAFLFRGLCKLIQQRQILMPKLQNLLEQTAIIIKKKVQKIMSPEECELLRLFFDSSQFVGTAEVTDAGNQSRSPQHDLSRTFEVAVQRYLHRYLNQLIGQQVLQLYQDPTCHHILCLTCRNANIISSSFLCPSADHVGPQRIPLKIWPPHLLHCGMRVLPALAKLVRLDVELWKRGLLDQRLSEKVVEFVEQILDTLYWDINLDPCRGGVIARRLIL